MDVNAELISAVEETIATLWQGYATGLTIAGLFVLAMATIAGLWD